MRGAGGLDGATWWDGDSERSVITALGVSKVSGSEARRRSVAQVKTVAI